MKKGLGKGLDALFADNEIEEKPQDAPVYVRISDIEPNRDQPRKTFDEEKLEELSRSIKQHGVLSPLLVKPIANGRYKIIAGERRWRASRLAGLNEVPVLIKDFDDLEAMEVALIENLQRDDLNAAEEAEGYRLLMDEYNLTQEQVAEKVSKSRPVIANALRLLNLPKETLELLRQGKITSGHGRALLSLPDKESINKTAEKILKENLTVRDIERMSKQKLKAVEGVQIDFENEYTKELEKKIEEYLGRKTRIIYGKSKGKIELEYYSEDDLEKLSQFLCGEEQG